MTKPSKAVAAEVAAEGGAVIALPRRGSGSGLRRQVEQALRVAIVSGRFAPGERLLERQLVELFNVSRTSLREALRQVEAEGLLVVHPHKGPVVTSITYEEAEEIYEARGVLEAQACSNFADRGSSAQLRSLRSVYDQLAAASQNQDVERTLAIKTEFYGIIISGAGNRVIQELLFQLNNRISILRRMSLSDAARLPEMLDEVSVLLEAMAAHDSRAAWSAALHHVRQAGRAALQAMRQKELVKPQAAEQRQPARGKARP